MIPDYVPKGAELVIEHSIYIYIYCVAFYILSNQHNWPLFSLANHSVMHILYGQQVYLNVYMTSNIIHVGKI